MQKESHMHANAALINPSLVVVISNWLEEHSEEVNSAIEAANQATQSVVRTAEDVWPDFCPHQ
jgi:hypothetical protein